MGTLFSHIRGAFSGINLFESGSNDDEVVRSERWSTALYLALLIISLLILITYTSLGNETVYVTVEDPSLQTYETLRSQYVETLKCPCSQIAVKYGRFVHIQPIYHQVCSSPFVTDAWIFASYGVNVSKIWPMDARTIISAHAQFLRSFCNNAQRGIDYVLNNVLSASLVSAEVLPLSLVQPQVNIQTESVRSAGKWQLAVLLNFLTLITSSSQLLTGIGTNALLYINSNDSTTAIPRINVYRVSSTSSPCACYTVDNCATPGAIYSAPQSPTYGFFSLDSLKASSTAIKGIQGACFAMGSVLSSTLECYYDSACLQLFVSNISSFPPLQSPAANHFAQNETIQNLIKALMVEEWSVNMSFASYYAGCAPTTCNYSFNRRNNILIIITTLVAIAGGLSTILRLLAPRMVEVGHKLKRRCKPKVTPVQGLVIIRARQSSIADKMKEFLPHLWRKARMLNLFDSKSTNLSTQKHERHTTRLYLFLLAVSFVILLFYTLWIEETTMYTVSSPSQSTYEQLYAKHSDTVECACKNIAIKYSTFLNIEITPHAVCSSSLINPAFFTQLAAIRTGIPLYPGDFMQLSVQYFQWLTTFCVLSQLVFSNQLIAFQDNLFVNSKLLRRDAFDVQATGLVDSFVSDIQYYFSRGILNTREMIAFSQPLSATFTMIYQLPITKTSNGSQVHIEPVDFFPDCSCLSNPTSCSDDAAFYTYQSQNNSFTPAFKVLGVRIACSSMESMLQSSLACWYSSDCYNTVVEYWRNRTYYLSNVPPPLDNSTSSRFKPSDTLSFIVGQLMVESWSRNVSFSDYFRECAPQYCTYSVTQRRAIILIVTILLGLLGGLNIALKILTPLFIRLANWLVAHRREYLSSFRNHLHGLSRRVREWNLFYDEDRSSESTLRAERHSTRLYLVCLLVSMLALTLYYSLAQSTLTISIPHPTQQKYETLRQSKEIAFLQCPCAHVSISYQQFVRANTSLHDICSSSFIELPWIESIFGNGHWSNLSSNAFYGRGGLYFQGLSSFCFLLRENITQYAAHFLASILINAQVVSERDLIAQVNETLEQTIIASRADHSDQYAFARDITSANQMLTIYSTNWIFPSIQYDVNLAGLPIPLTPVSRGNCSCATSASCNEPVIHNGQIVPGLVVGCLPHETLFRSTLICLYNQTCIDQINIEHLPVTPLPMPSNKDFAINRTVEQLLATAFDQQWSIDINYTKYFDECQPTSCFYSLSQGRGALQIIITLLGLYGGLAVALRIIVPYLIAFLHRIFLKEQELHHNRPTRY